MIVRRCALAALMVVTGLATMPVTPSEAVSAPTAISTAPYLLSANYALASTVVSALDAKLPNVTVGTVMAHGNHTRQPLCHTDTITQVNGPQAGFCYESADDNDCHNTPQGITTSRDAVNGDYSGHQIVVTSWYYHTNCGSFGDDGATTRSRLTFVDWDASGPNTYRKVLLVQPTGTASNPNFKDIPIHTGGIAWYGNYLYVADTSRGLRVFDMAKIWQVDSGGSSSAIGMSGGTYKAHNYAYVLPQVGMISDVSTSRLTWSSVALDRAKPSLVMAEYATTTGHRAVRFPLSSTTHKLVVGSGSHVHAAQALRLPYAGIQSALSHNGRWWFASSRDKRLYYWNPGHAVVAHTWVGYCEDLSYWEDPGPGPDLIWSLHEPLNGRNVFYTPQSYLS